MDYFHSYLPSQYLNVVYVDNFIFSRLEMFHNLLQCYMIFLVYYLESFHPSEYIRYMSFILKCLLSP